MARTRLSGQTTGSPQIYFASLYFYKAFSTKPHIGLRSSFVASAGGSLICEIHVNALMVDLDLSISPMATLMGFEPTTSCVTGKRSILLNYKAI